MDLAAIQAQLRKERNGRDDPSSPKQGQPMGFGRGAGRGSASVGMKRYPSSPLGRDDDYFKRPRYDPTPVEHVPFEMPAKASVDKGTPTLRSYMRDQINRVDPLVNEAYIQAKNSRYHTVKIGQAMQSCLIIYQSLYLSQYEDFYQFVELKCITEVVDFAPISDEIENFLKG